MFRPDLSRLSPEEKDALILALLDRVAALEAKLARPPKTPNNSSVPPSRGRKANRPPRPKKPRRKQEHPGVTRQLAAAADHVVDCHARACMHCGAVVSAAGQVMRHVYDHIDLPPIRPVVTRVRIFGRRCPGCRRRVRGVPPKTMPPGSPFGPSIVTMLAYLHHHHAVGYQRLSKLMTELFGLSISEGGIANALRRAHRPLKRAGAAITEQLRRAAVIGCDETGARLTTDALGGVGVGAGQRHSRAAPYPPVARPRRDCRSARQASAPLLGLGPLVRPAGPCREPSGLPRPCAARCPICR